MHTYIRRKMHIEKETDWPRERERGRKKERDLMALIIGLVGRKRDV